MPPNCIMNVYNLPWRSQENGTKRKEPHSLKCLSRKFLVLLFQGSYCQFICVKLISQPFEMSVLLGKISHGFRPLTRLVGSEERTTSTNTCF